MAPSVMSPTASHAGSVANARAALHTEQYRCAWVHICNIDGAAILYVSGQRLLDGTTPVGDATDSIPIGPGEVYQFPPLSNVNAYDLAHLYLSSDDAGGSPYILLVGTY